MSLFLALLPLYLFGNLHCIGMCGPLVMLLARHRYRYYYFLGRTLSFTLAGLVAGEVGAVLDLILGRWHISGMISLGIGLVIIAVAISPLCSFSLPGRRWWSSKLSRASAKLALLINQDTPLTTTLFGLGTVLLPCGQTLVVFSACAIQGSPLIGAFNGCAFAVLTSPSLWIAMRLAHWAQRLRKYQQPLFIASALFIGALALCRGMAELDLIPHWILNNSSPGDYHIVMF